MRMLVAVVSLAIVAGACAQTPRDVSLTADKAPVRDVLTKLFAGTGLEYKLDPSVQGDVTAHLSGVPFDTALRSVLRQLLLTYAVEGGVYVISAPPPPAQQDSGDADSPSDSNIVTVKIKVHHVPSSVMLAMLLGFPRWQYLGPFDRPPDAMFVSFVRRAFFDAVGNPWYFTSGVSFPLWLGGGWENVGRGYGR